MAARPRLVRQLQAAPSTPDEMKRQQAALWQTHPRYDEFYDTWKLLGHVYEGDGPFLDGSALIAHPRELNYKQTADGIDKSDVISEKDKFTRRKRIARYENFAQIIIDTFVDYQYAKEPTRSIQKNGLSGLSAQHPLEAWWEDVDGHGTHITDWMKTHQVLADVYGHLVVVMAQLPNPSGRPARTLAEQGRFVLRAYTPLDTLDWLADGHILTAVKLIEVPERKTLDERNTNETLQTTTARVEDLQNVEFRLIDDEKWTHWNKSGVRLGGSFHSFGQAPLAVFYSRRRARNPVLGRSILKDPRLFRDHFNLVSELRELLRSQTFSMLNIQLGVEEEVSDARARLGESASTETILWSRGGAAFIAPSEGPASTYSSEIEALERKIFRLIGLPWEGDSSAAESGDSRRLKAMDLNRLLAGCADESQRFEYDIARLWMIGTYGRELGLKAFESSELTIKYPDEFNTEQLAQVVTDVREAMTLNLGVTANAIMKKRALPTLIPDLDPGQKAIIEQEIDDATSIDSEFEAVQRQLSIDAQMQFAPDAQQPESGMEGPPPDQEEQ